MKVLGSFKYWTPFIIMKERPDGVGQRSVVTFGDIIDAKNELKREYETYKSQIDMLEKVTDEFLNKQVVEAVSRAANRSRAQTQFLFDLCDRNLPKLLKLEEKIKNTFTFYCPGDKETVEHVLKLKNKTNLLRFKNFHFDGDQLVLER